MFLCLVQFCIWANCVDRSFTLKWNYEPISGTISFPNKNGPPNPLLTLCLISLIAFSCPHVADDKQIIMLKKKVAIVCLLTHIAQGQCCLFFFSQASWSLLSYHKPSYSFAFVKDIGAKGCGDNGCWGTLTEDVGVCIINNARGQDE